MSHISPASRLLGVGGGAHAPSWAPELDPTHPLSSGLVAWYLNGQELVGRQAKLSSTAPPGAVATPIGTLDKFNGSNQYWSVPDTGLPSGGSDRAFSVWFSATALPGVGLMMVFSYGTPGGNSPNYLYITNATSLVFGSNSSNWINLTAPASMLDGGLHHIAVSFNSAVGGTPGTWTALLDGKTVVTNNAGLPPTTSLPSLLGLNLGRYISSSSTVVANGYTNGVTDNLKIWNRPLTLVDMRAEFDRPFGLMRPARRRLLSAAVAANPLSGTLSYGAETVSGTLTQADPLSGAFGYGAETTAGTLTQADPLSGGFSYGAETASGTLTEANPLAASFSYGPMALAGNLLEEDTLSAVLSYGGLQLAGVVALPLSGALNYGYSVSGVIALPLSGTLDYGPAAISGSLAVENSVAGVLSYGGLTVAGTLAAAVSFSATLDYGPLAVAGNLLEQDTLSGALNYGGLGLSGNVTGAAYAVLDYGYSVAGTLTQRNALAGDLRYPELTSEGVLTDADNAVGILTYAPPQVVGTLTQDNPLSGGWTFQHRVLGSLLEQDTASGTITYDGVQVDGVLGQADPIDGSLGYGAYGLSGAIHAELLAAPAAATMPPGRIGTVRPDSRRAALPYDSRMVQ